MMIRMGLLFKNFVEKRIFQGFDINEENARNIVSALGITLQPVLIADPYIKILINACKKDSSKKTRNAIKSALICTLKKYSSDIYTSLFKGTGNCTIALIKSIVINGSSSISDYKSALRYHQDFQQFLGFMHFFYEKYAINAECVLSSCESLSEKSICDVLLCVLLMKTACEFLQKFFDDTCRFVIRSSQAINISTVDDECFSKTAGALLSIRDRWKDFDVNNKKFSEKNYQPELGKLLCAGSDGDDLESTKSEIYESVNRILDKNIQIEHINSTILAHCIF